MLLPSGNPIKCHEEVLSWQSMFLAKRFDIFPPSGGWSEGLDAFRFFHNGGPFYYKLSIIGVKSTR